MNIKIRGKTANTRIIGSVIATISMLIMAVIIGSVENGITFTQTLTSTIGDYVEPLGVLSAFAIIGGAVYMAVRK